MDIKELIKNRGKHSGAGLKRTTVSTSNTTGPWQNRPRLPSTAIRTSTLSARDADASSRRKSPNARHGK